MSFHKILYGFAIFIIFFFVTLYFFHPIPLSGLNTDLGFHLTFGKIIATEGFFPSTNLLSYTFPNYSFINANWGAQVVFYFFHKAFGFDGLIILSVLLVVSAFSLLLVYAANKYHLFSIVVVLLLYLQIIPGRSQVRPELFSFLFLALFVIILYKYKDTYTKWIFALIPLSLLWVNIHIYFFTGIIVLLLFIVDALLLKRDKIKSKKFLTLIFVTIFSILILLCNPYGIKGVLHPLLVLNNYGFSVRENLNYFAVFDFVYKPTMFFFTISWLGLWLCLLVSRKKMQPVDFLLSAFFTFMAFFAIRNFPLFVFGTFIPAVTASSVVLKMIVKKYKQKTLVIKWMTLGVICILLIPSVASNIESRGFGPGVIDNAKGGLDFLEKNNIQGPIYNNFDIGSYLDYYLYPEEKVFVDNRAEAYPEEFFQNIYYPMQRSESLFNTMSNKYKFNVIFFTHTDGGRDARKMLNRLVKDDTWNMVYLDSLIVIFVKNNPENQKLIEKYVINQKNVKISEEELKDKDKVLQLALFFGSVGWVDKFVDMNLRYLHLDPTHCPSLQNIVYIYQKQKNPSYTIYARKYLHSCK